MCMCLDCGRRPENLERTHAGTVRTRKLHTEKPRGEDRIMELIYLDLDWLGTSGFNLFCGPLPVSKPSCFDVFDFPSFFYLQLLHLVWSLSLVFLGTECKTILFHPFFSLLFLPQSVPVCLLCRVALMILFYFLSQVRGFAIWQHTAAESSTLRCY